LSRMNRVRHRRKTLSLKREREMCQGSGVA
jgi:hypothetical protein